MGLCMSNNAKEGGNTNQPANKTDNKPVDNKQTDTKKNEPKKDPKKDEPSPAATSPTSPTSPDSSGAKTGCEAYKLASGTYSPVIYKFDDKKNTIIIESNSWPAVTNNFVTDGKVVFDKAALGVKGVIPTRKEEMDLLNKIQTVKDEASKLSAKAQEIFASSQPYFDAADAAHKSGNHEEKHSNLNKGKEIQAESKKVKEQANEKHGEADQLQYAVAMSMAIKAKYTKRFEYDLYGNGKKMQYRVPEIDYHHFLEQGMQRTIDAAWDVMKDNKFGEKTTLFIPGAGTHTAKDKKCVTIPLYKDFVKRNKFEKYETEVTHGSWEITLP